MRKKLLLLVTVGLCAILSVAAFAGCESGVPGQPAGKCTHEKVSESIVTAATCETSGLKKIVCDSCGTVVEDNVAVDALGHAYEKSITSATCEDDEKWTFVCGREGCGKSYSETQEGTRLGHDYQLVQNESEEATCKKVGKNVYRCSHEGCSDGYEDVIPVTDHKSDGSKSEVTSPTCKQRGYTTYHCEWCDEDYQADFINPTGQHVYVESTLAATCTSFGYTVEGCGCGDVKSKAVSANPAAHEFQTDGKCKACGKDALDAFALNYGTGTPFLIEKDRNVYTVYSEAYAEQNIVIPVSMLNALYNKGVKSLRISVGYGNNQEALDLSVKVQNGAATTLTAKAVRGVMTRVGDSIVFANEDGLLDSVKTTGIVIGVKYGASGQAEASDEYPVTNYSISIDYDTTFDVNDTRTWVYSDGVSMDLIPNEWPASYNVAFECEISPLKVYSEDDSGVTVLTIRKEFLQAMYEAGKTKFEIGVWGAGVFASYNIRDGYEEDSNIYLQHPMANGFSWDGLLTLTEEMCSKDLYFEVQSSVNDPAINALRILFGFSVQA